MRRIFTTFADAKYLPSLRRIAAQAKAMNVYDEIWPHCERDLSSSFRHRHRRMLRPDVRGFGYYIWKPHIVYDTLLRCHDGDIVHWCDAGCHLRPAGRQRLIEYLDLAAAAPSGVLAFRFTPPTPPFPHDGRPLPNLVNVEWCKSDCLAHFGLLEDAAFLEDFQVASTTFFVRKTDATMAVMKRWRDDVDRDVSLFDDSPSRLPNSPRFREHRHDQAAFSCLAWLHEFQDLSAFEFDYPLLPGEPKPSPVIDGYPICAIRDKKHSLRFRAVRKLRRIWRSFLGRRDGDRR